MLSAAQAFRPSPWLFGWRPASIHAAPSIFALKLIICGGLLYLSRIPDLKPFASLILSARGIASRRSSWKVLFDACDHWSDISAIWWLRFVPRLYKMRVDRAYGVHLCQGIVWSGECWSFERAFERNDTWSRSSIVSKWWLVLIHLAALDLEGIIVVSFIPATDRKDSRGRTVRFESAHAQRKIDTQARIEGKVQNLRREVSICIEHFRPTARILTKTTTNVICYSVSLCWRSSVKEQARGPALSTTIALKLCR